jgi:hypothetical protein
VEVAGLRWKYIKVHESAANGVVNPLTIVEESQIRRKPDRAALTIPFRTAPAIPEMSPVTMMIRNA